MNQILLPVVTEKSINATEKGVYTFKVPNDFNKLSVKRDVEARFKVHVTRVAMQNTPSKELRRGRFTGTRSGYKKAIVQLKKGETIKELEG